MAVIGWESVLQENDKKPEQEERERKKDHTHTQQPTHGKRDHKLLNNIYDN